MSRLLFYNLSNGIKYVNQFLLLQQSISTISQYALALPAPAAHLCTPAVSLESEQSSERHESLTRTQKPFATTPTQNTSYISPRQQSSCQHTFPPRPRVACALCMQVQRACILWVASSPPRASPGGSSCWCCRSTAL